MADELLPLPDDVRGLLQMLRDAFGPGDAETAEADIRAYTRAHLAARDAEIERLREALAQAHKDYGFELRDPNGTIWQYADRVTKERDALRADVEALREDAARLDWLQKRLHGVDFEYAQDELKAAPMLLIALPESARVSKNLRATVDAAMRQEGGE